MKSSLLIRLFMVFFSVALLPAHLVLGQDDGPQDKTKQDKIKSLEIAYIAKQLDLTPEEAQKFWPVYNEYTREVNALIAERKRKVQETRGKLRDDAVAEDALDKELGYEKKVLDIRTRYKDRFLKVLPAGKVAMVYRAERDFRNMMIRTIKERRDARMMQRRR